MTDCIYYFFSERNTILLAHTKALKEINAELERELDQLKIKYNEMDNENAELWSERLLQYPTSPPPPSAYSFDVKRYLDHMAKDREAKTGQESYVRTTKRILSEDEKLELRVKKILLAKDALERKPRNERYADAGYFGFEDMDIAKLLM